MNKKKTSKQFGFFKQLKLLILAVTGYLFLGVGVETENCSITVKVVGIQNKKGVVEIGLYSNPAKFPIPGKTLKMVRPSITGKDLTYTFENLPKGDYAIAIYHDENSDKKCNRNFFGIPTEAYAFSNNYRPILSVPKFTDCSFHVEGDKKVTILLIY